MQPIIRVSPQQVPIAVVVNIRVPTASGMYSDVMGRTGACLDTTAHRTGIPSSETKFRYAERHGIRWHAPNYTAKLARVRLVQSPRGEFNG